MSCHALVCRESSKKAVSFLFIALAERHPRIRPGKPVNQGRPIMSPSRYGIPSQIPGSTTTNVATPSAVVHSPNKSARGQPSFLPSWMEFLRSVCASNGAINATIDMQTTPRDASTKLSMSGPTLEVSGAGFFFRGRLTELLGGTRLMGGSVQPTTYGKQSWQQGQHAQNYRRSRPIESW